MVLDLVEASPVTRGVFVAKVPRYAHTPEPNQNRPLALENSDGLELTISSRCLQHGFTTVILDATGWESGLGARIRECRLTMMNFSTPLPRRRSHNRFESPTKCGLIGKPRLQSRFGKSARGVRQQCFCFFDALQDQVLVCRSAKGPSERACEMADLEPAFLRQSREPHRTVQMLSQKLHRPTLLPGRKTAAVRFYRERRRGIRSGHVRAKEQTEMIEEQF